MIDGDDLSDPHLQDRIARLVKDFVRITQAVSANASGG